MWTARKTNGRNEYVKPGPYNGEFVVSFVRSGCIPGWRIDLVNRYGYVEKYGCGFATKAQAQNAARDLV